MKIFYHYYLTNTMWACSNFTMATLKCFLNLIYVRRQEQHKLIYISRASSLLNSEGLMDELPLLKLCKILYMYNILVWFCTCSNLYFLEVNALNHYYILEWDSPREKNIYIYSRFRMFNDVFRFLQLIFVYLGLPYFFLSNFFPAVCGPVHGLLQQPHVINLLNMDILRDLKI